MYWESKCIGARDCIRVCPNQALTLTHQGIVTDADKCHLCGLCVDACPGKAMEISGRTLSTEALLALLEKERLVFDQTGGGVTFSGGEPLFHYPLLLEMLKACGEHDIHRTVDTSGYAKTENIREVARHTDLFLYDLKLVDEQKHRFYTGVSNEIILKNLRILACEGAPLQIRIPFIHNVNSDRESVEQFALFLSGLDGNIREINLLPYHNIASGKYKRLGKENPAEKLQEPNGEEMERALACFSRHGLQARIGG